MSSLWLCVSTTMQDKFPSYWSLHFSDLTWEMKLCSCALCPPKISQFSCFSFQDVSCYSFHGGGMMLGIQTNKDTFCPSSPRLYIRLHPFPFQRLRKQVNQPQKPVGCETNPGPTSSPRSHQSLHLDSKWKTKLQNSHPTLSLANASLCWNQHYRAGSSRTLQTWR